MRKKSPKENEKALKSLRNQVAWAAKTVASAKERYEALVAELKNAEREMAKTTRV